MKFEYDTKKSLSNKQKHGIDFEEAKLLWNDDKMVEIKTSYEDEERFITISKPWRKIVSPTAKLFLTLMYPTSPSSYF